MNALGRRVAAIVCVFAAGACHHSPSTSLDAGNADLAATGAVDMALTSAPLWPLPGHDSQRRSASSLLGPTTPVTLKWTSPMLNGYVGPLLDRTGTIYEQLVQGDAIIDPTSGGVIRANGQLWRNFGLGEDGTPYIESSPTQLSALDPATLIPRWSATVPDHPAYALAITEGTVYFMGGASVVAASTVDGSTQWTQPFAFDIVKAPNPGLALGLDGAVVAVDSTRCVSFDGTTGQPRWTATAAQMINFPPVVGADGSIYLVEGYGGGEVFLAALNPSDGSVRWNVDLQTIQRSGPPAVAPDGTILMLTPTRYAAFGLDGQTKWSVAVNMAAFTSQPTVDAAGNSFIVTDSGNTIAVFAATGSPLWTAPATKPVNGPFVIGDAGMLYVNGANEESLFAYSP